MMQLEHKNVGSGQAMFSVFSVALVGTIHSEHFAVLLFFYLTLYSKAYQPGREVLVPFYSLHGPTEEHPWAEVRPHAQLCLPSHVSIICSVFLTHPPILMRHCFLGVSKRNPSTHHFTPSISCCWGSSEWRRNRLPLSGIMLWVTLTQLPSCRGNVTGGGGLLDFDVVLFHTGRCHRVLLEGLSHPLCLKILLTCYILACWWESSIIFCFQVNRKHLIPTSSNDDYQSLKLTFIRWKELYRKSLILLKLFAVAKQIGNAIICKCNMLEIQNFRKIDRI